MFAVGILYANELTGEIIMGIAIALMALLAGSYLFVNFYASRSRELDQLIALENQAEVLRKRCTYNARGREKSVKQRNQTLARIARKRKQVVQHQRIRSVDLNRMVVARRRALG